MSCDDTGRRPVGSVGMSRVWEIDPSLIDWKTGDCSPRDLGYSPLKEGREERIAQRVLHRLERPSYIRGGPMHKSPLLM